MLYIYFQVWLNLVFWFGVFSIFFNRFGLRIFHYSVNFLITMKSWVGFCSNFQIVFVYSYYLTKLKILFRIFSIFWVILDLDFWTIAWNFLWLWNHEIQFTKTLRKGLLLRCLLILTVLSNLKCYFFQLWTVYDLYRASHTLNILSTYINIDVFWILYWPKIRSITFILTVTLRVQYIEILEKYYILRL